MFLINDRMDKSDAFGAEVGNSECSDLGKSKQVDAEK